MKFSDRLEFASDESGAITVDWVVLTAAIVAIAIAMVGIVESGLLNAASEINLTSAS